MIRKLVLAASFCLSSVVLAAGAESNASFENVALQAAQPHVDTSIREWHDAEPLKLSLRVFQTHRLRLADLHDRALDQFTGYRYAPLPNVDIAIVEVNAYADGTPTNETEIAKRPIYWRMVFGLKALAGHSPEIFFSTEPFSGDCGDPMTKVMPGRLLRIDRKFILEMKEEQLFHGCADQDETVRRVVHLFNVDNNFRDVFQYEEFFFDSTKAVTAMVNPVQIGDESGSALLFQTVTSFSGRPRKGIAGYLKWTKDGLLALDKKKWDVH